MARGKPFERGNKANPGGRPPGSKNKFTKLKSREVWEYLNERECNPFEILADLAMTSRSEKVRCEAAAELCQYLEPKLKAIELKGDKDAGLTFVFNGVAINQAPLLPPTEEVTN